MERAFLPAPGSPASGDVRPVPARGPGAPRRSAAPVPVGRAPSYGPGPSRVGGGGTECVDVLGDVDSLLMSIDTCHDGAPEGGEGSGDAIEAGGEEGSGEVVAEGGGSNMDSSVIPWMDRYESTERLLKQLEETLRLMEARGVNLSSAWELANTARSLLDSADVIMALIYANRALRLALEVHRLHDGLGGTAS